MRFVYLCPASAAARYLPGMALKGATLFRLADYQAMRLASITAPSDDFIYLDERVEEIEMPSGTDLVVMPVTAPAVNRAFELSQQLTGSGLKIIFFGDYPTLKPKVCSNFATSVVRGDITSVWPSILKDIKRNRLKKLYRANNHVSFKVDRRSEDKMGLFRHLAQLYTSFGCTCADEFGGYCSERILYPEVVSMSTSDILTTVSTINKKVIWLKDDDALYDLDRAERLFRQAWSFKKEWIIQTSHRLFERPGFLWLLKEAGVRIIFLKQDWLRTDRITDADDRTEWLKQKRREVDEIHFNRILVGAKVRLEVKEWQRFDAKAFYRMLFGLHIDFLEFSVPTPIPRLEELLRVSEARAVGE